MAKVITKFWGNGCINCKAMTPILEGIKKDYADVEFRDINTSTDHEAVEKYSITSLPTLVFEKDGNEVGRLMGLKPAVLIKKKIDEVF